MPFDAANLAPFGYTVHGKPRVRPARPGEGSTNRRIHEPDYADEAVRVRCMIVQRIKRAKIRGERASKSPARRPGWANLPAVLLCCELLIERHVRRQRMNGSRDSGD